MTTAGMPRAVGFRAPGPYPAVGGQGQDHDAEALAEDRAKDLFIRRINDLRRRGAATASASCRPHPYPFPIVVDRKLGLVLRLAYARRDDRAMIIPDCFPV